MSFGFGNNPYKTNIPMPAWLYPIANSAYGVNALPERRWHEPEAAATNKAIQEELKRLKRPYGNTTGQWTIETIKGIQQSIVLAGYGIGTVDNVPDGTVRRQVVEGVMNYARDKNPAGLEFEPNTLWSHEKGGAQGQVYWLVFLHRLMDVPTPQTGIGGGIGHGG